MAPYEDYEALGATLVGTKCKFEEIYQQVASLNRMYRKFMLGIFAFDSARPQPVLAFCTPNFMIRIAFCKVADVG